MLTALLNNQQVLAEKMTIRTEKYTCPFCKERMILVKPEADIIDHFRHKVICKYITEPESYEHLTGKKWLYDFFIRQGYQCELEKRIGNRIADILVYNGKKIVAVEYQCSPISLADFKKRNESYAEDKISVLWVWGIKNYYNKHRAVKERNSINGYRLFPSCFLQFDFYCNGHEFFIYLYVGKNYLSEEVVYQKLDIPNNWNTIKRLIFCSEWYRLLNINSSSADWFDNIEFDIESEHKKFLRRLLRKKAISAFITAGYNQSKFNESIIYKKGRRGTFFINMDTPAFWIGNMRNDYESYWAEREELNRLEKIGIICQFEDGEITWNEDITTYMQSELSLWM